jgi:hypothetical protein
MEAVIETQLTNGEAGTPESGGEPILVRLKCRPQEKRPTTPVKSGLLLCSIQPSTQALSPDLSDCRNRGLRDIGPLNTRWYLSRNEEASMVIVGNRSLRSKEPELWIRGKVH